MKLTPVLLLMLCTAAPSAFAVNLNEQIKQNVDAAMKSYQDIVKKQPPQLWIHVRTEEQRQLLQHIADWLKPLSVVRIEPIQLVKEGPKKSQLRFFSDQDKQGASELLSKLQKIFPQLELQDLSSEYGNLGLFDAGHYELWLAPELKKIVLPEVAPTTNSILPAKKP